MNAELDPDSFTAFLWSFCGVLWDIQNWNWDLLKYRRLSLSLTVQQCKKALIQLRSACKYFDCPVTVQVPCNPRFALMLQLLWSVYPSEGWDHFNLSSYGCENKITIASSIKSCGWKVRESFRNEICKCLPPFSYFILLSNLILLSCPNCSPFGRNYSAKCHRSIVVPLLFFKGYNVSSVTSSILKRYIPSLRSTHPARVFVQLSLVSLAEEKSLCMSSCKSLWVSGERKWMQMIQKGA